MPGRVGLRVCDCACLRVSSCGHQATATVKKYPRGCFGLTIMPYRADPYNGATGPQGHVPSGHLIPPSISEQGHYPTSSSASSPQSSVLRPFVPPGSYPQPHSRPPFHDHRISSGSVWQSAEGMPSYPTEGDRRETVQRTPESTVTQTAEKTAASALLLAANTTSTTTNVSTTTTAANTTTTMTKDETATVVSLPVSRSSGPPKKRKKHLDVLRRNRMENYTYQQHQPQQQQSETDGPATTSSSIASSAKNANSPCQISPVSTAVSVSSSSQNETTSAASVCEADLSPMPRGPSSSSSTSTPNGSSLGSSFDYKSSKTQTLTDSAKIGDTNEISPHPAVTDFPFKLHRILTSNRYGGILQWLPHGQAWRILRWDALQRQVLPENLPQLCEEGTEGSIDAFLWNVRAWGFEEIRDGHDIGAYHNKVRFDSYSHIVVTPRDLFRFRWHVHCPSDSHMPVDVFAHLSGHAAHKLHV